MPPGTLDARRTENGAGGLLVDLILLQTRQSVILSPMTLSPMTEPLSPGPTARIRRHPEAAGESTPDDFLVLDLRNGRYYGLGPVGGFVWECLEEEPTVAELIEQVVKVFEVDEETATADMMEFLAEMTDSGLMVVSPPGGDD